METVKYPTYERFYKKDIFLPQKYSKIFASYFKEKIMALKNMKHLAACHFYK